MYIVIVMVADQALYSKKYFFQEVIEMEKSHNELVKMANKINKSRYQLSKQPQRFLIYAIKETNQEEQYFTKMSLSIKDIAEATGMS